jgi:subtilase family serine protease
LGSDAVSSLGAGGTSSENETFTPSQSAGTYYVGACVESVSGESNTNNQCSTGVEVTITASTAPDLIVQSPSTDKSSIEEGDSLTIYATVKNQGDASSDSTTLKYYISNDATISTGDTQLGSDAVSSLGAGGTSSENETFTPSQSAGTYYVGACVESVSGETNVVNQCSTGKQLTITNPVPSAPTGVDASYGTYESKVRISWNSVDGADLYRVYRCSSSTTSSCSRITTTSRTTYDDTRGATGTRYYYRVKAHNSSGYSDFSTYDIGYKRTSSPDPDPSPTPKPSGGAMGYLFPLFALLLMMFRREDS